MTILYSRVTPFGFIDPEQATDADMFYAETVEVPDGYDAAELLASAERLRGLYAESAAIQTRGFESAAQAVEMARLLEEVA